MRRPPYRVSRIAYKRVCKKAKMNLVSWAELSTNPMLIWKTHLWCPERQYRDEAAHPVCRVDTSSTSPRMESLSQTLSSVLACKTLRQDQVETKLTKSIKLKVLSNNRSSRKNLSQQMLMPLWQGKILRKIMKAKVPTIKESRSITQMTAKWEACLPIPSLFIVICKKD